MVTTAGTGKPGTHATLGRPALLIPTDLSTFVQLPRREAKIPVSALHSGFYYGTSVLVPIIPTGRCLMLHVDCSASAPQIAIRFIQQLVGTNRYSVLVWNLIDVCEFSSTP